MKDQFKEIVHENINGFKLDPPDAVWDRVGKTLDDKKDRSRVVLLRNGLAACAAILLPILLFFTSTDKGVQDGKNSVKNILLSKGESYELIEESSAIGGNGLGLSVNDVILKNVVVVSPDILRTHLEDSILVHKNKEESLLQKLTLISRVAPSLLVLSPAPQINLKHWERMKQDEAIMASNLREIDADKKHDIDFQSAISTQYAALAMVSNKVGQAGATNYDLDGGVNYILKSNKKVSFETGIHMTKMSQSTDGISFLTDKQNESFFGKAKVVGNENIWGSIDKSVLSSVGVIDRPLPIDKELNNGYYSSVIDICQAAHYLEVPLILRYNIMNTRLGVDLLGGIHTNFLIKNQADVSNGTDRYVTKTNGLKTVTSSSVFGFSVYYDLGAKLQLNIDPRAKYYYSSLTSSGNSSLKPLVFGMYAGLAYSF